MNYKGRMLVGWFLILLGVGFWFDINIWRYFWPLVLIIAGLRMLNRAERPGWMKEEESEEDKLNYSVIFAGLNKKIISDEFRGGKITVLFGGGELDLSKAKLKNNEGELQIDTIFGGMKIIVPAGWRVETEMTTILGGVKNRTKRVKSGTEKEKLIIRGSVIFGGVEVVN